MKVSTQLFDEIKNKPTIINSFSENDLVNIIKEANNQYYNKNKSVISDEIYDVIIDKIKTINPNNPILKSVGAPIDTKNKKVKLPYWMGSQDKIKTDKKVLDRWIKKYPNNFILTDKLDGISALFEIKDGKYNLYTRGDGEYGSDISRMIKYINNIPKNLNEDIAIRGELVISKKNWPKIAHLGSNPRNTVSGVFNSKTPNLDIIKYIDFVTYQVLNPSNLTPFDQFNYLSVNNFDITTMTLIKNIDIENLSNYFNERRQNSEYEIDGIVVIHNQIYKNITSGNPKYSFAFKNMLTNDGAEVTVLDIQWDISKDGYLIPIIIFPPTDIGGVQVQRATGFNGKYIKDNILGPGSKIMVIRSGEVIPYVTQIIKPADSGKPKMPDVDYTWNDSGVDIIINNKNSAELQKKLLVNFFTKMKTKGVSSGIINKLYDAGFNTIYKVLHITIEQLQSVDGIQIRSANNIYNAIQEIDLNNCITLMTASNTFGRGFGERKIKLITDVYPNLIRETPTITELINIDGINTITAKNFIECLDKFKNFLEENQLSCNLQKQTKLILHGPAQSIMSKNLENIAVLFTGFRDKDMENDIILRGGIIKSSLNKTVNILIVKDEELENKKTEKAQDLNIDILSKDNFIIKYLSN
jgi:NAD-dependent DNA ligase